MRLETLRCQRLAVAREGCTVRLYCRGSPRQRAGSARSHDQRESNALFEGGASQPNANRCAMVSIPAPQPALPNAPAPPPPPPPPAPLLFYHDHRPFQGRATAGAVSRRIRGAVGAGDDCCGGGRTARAFTGIARGTDGGASGTLNSDSVGGRIMAGGRPAGRRRRRRLSSAGLPAAAAAVAGSPFVSGGRERRSPFCRSPPNLAAAGRIATVSTPAALPASSFSSRSPPTCCFFSSTAAANDGGSATPTAGSDGGSGGGSIDGDGDGDGDGEKKAEEWPAPHPGQAYVARARCGRRYEHPEGGARIRAVVSDLDGTLLGPDKMVSATTLEAVRKARCEVTVGVEVEV